MAHMSTNIGDLPWTFQHHNSNGVSPSQSTSTSEKSSTLSDSSSSLPSGNMDPPLPSGREDISTVLTQVLDRMDRVVEHLRSKRETDAANSIAKNIIEIIKTFNNATATWDKEMSIMYPVAAPITMPLTISRNQQASLDPLPAQKANSPSTWAAVAAVAPADKNSVVKVMSQDITQMSAIIAKADVDTVDPDLRVLWIRGWKEDRSLADVTKQIGQGPIYSMAYSPKDTSVCVIFQYARSAKALHEDEQRYIRLHGRSRFGDGCSLIIGLAFPENDDILRMASPYNERRRLTFARQQLFTHGLTEAKFKADIYSVVGPSNVELVWLFNSGNATVVLSAVPLARMVRDEFIKISRQSNSPYRDVHITFSHDPCERPMSLIKQMPAGRDFREGTYGGESALPVGIITKSAPSGRRNARDADGWQTVGRRH